MNGSRVNSIVDELRGEKIDIVDWDENPGNLIQNALSPLTRIVVLTIRRSAILCLNVTELQSVYHIGTSGYYGSTIVFILTYLMECLDVLVSVIQSNLNL